MRFNVDFDQAPLLLIWEVTRSCELACVHCRAEAIHRRHPDELTLEEGKRLIDHVQAMGTPLIIFTGGDPLQRDDLEDLIRHAKQIGLRAGTIPATTYRLTRERMISLKDAGVDQLALSIDGVNEEKHDAFRQVPGSFAKAMQGAAWARELEIPLQINTVLGAWNFNDYDELAALVESLGIVFWDVFFLVPTGRGTTLKSCSADQFEILFEKLEAISRRVPYVVKITEGQHYRRYLAEQKKEANGHKPLHMPKVAVNAGRGFCFVDHVGEVCPSGFLPIPCGYVRSQSVADIYRNHPTFTGLRDTSRLEGKCRRCKHRDVCGGGSRARAFGLTGNLYAPEPFCAYR
jgi:radical SAM protein with 4Fe4S-binding SPASM domain